MLGCMCQQIGLPWLKTLISSNMFLTHTKGSSTQLISPSSMKSFQFSAPHLTSHSRAPLEEPGALRLTPLGTAEAVIDTLSVLSF